MGIQNLSGAVTDYNIGCSKKRSLSIFICRELRHYISGSKGGVPKRADEGEHESRLGSFPSSYASLSYSGGHARPLSW